LTWLDPNIAGDAITLVEDTENRDPVGHRGHGNLLAGAGISLRQSHRIRWFVRFLLTTASGRHEKH
jgi:hypothetical protein